MRFVGGGIGHKCIDFLQQRLSTSITEEPEVLPILHDDQEDITPHTQDHVQGGEDSDIEVDPEEVNSDEDADFGYADDSLDWGSESDDHDSEGDDNEGKEGTDSDEEEDEAL